VRLSKQPTTQVRHDFIPLLFTHDDDIEVGFCGSSGFAVPVILPILLIVLSI
jgi:hypothetical protein